MHSGKNIQKNPSITVAFNANTKCDAGCQNCFFFQRSIWHKTHGKCFTRLNFHLLCCFTQRYYTRLYWCKAAAVRLIKFFYCWFVIVNRCLWQIDSIVCLFFVGHKETKGFILGFGFHFIKKIDFFQRSERGREASCVFTRGWPIWIYHFCHWSTKTIFSDS